MDTPETATVEVTQADDFLGGAILRLVNGMISEIVAGRKVDDVALSKQIGEAIARHRTRATRQDGLREALDALLAAQQVQPYRGWNLTALNKAADDARALLGLPSVRDLNPDIAKMQDAAVANKEAIAGVIARRDTFLPMDQWDARDETVLLLVDYTDGDHPLDDAIFAITIGHNNDHNTDETDGWKFAGWCWSHDHYVEGKGKPVGWMPLPHHLAAALSASPEGEGK